MSWSATCAPSQSREFGIQRPQRTFGGCGAPSASRFAVSAMCCIYMMPDGQRSKFTELAASFTPAILIVSTQVGRGAYVLGEAIAQQLSSLPEVYHRPIEDLVSQAIFNEDVKRYRFIST